MGLTKTEQYSKMQNELAVILKAMGHPARIAIVEYLLKVDQCICNDLVEELPLSQSTISQHLLELKQAGIIQGTIEGNSKCYCLQKQNLSKVMKFVSKCVSNLSSDKIKCC